MKIATPIITLIVGVALAASLYFSDTTAVSAKKAALAAASASAVANPGAAATTGATQQATGAATAHSPSPTASSGFVIPAQANYVGESMGDNGWVAIAVHSTFAIAYLCNNGTQEAWFKGTPHDGKLSMTGTGGATLTANYALGHARGTVVLNGISYVFSIIAVHRPSGLYESIAVVRGATVKAGWIVLANGTVVGSLNTNVNAASPVSQRAPKLDLSTLTAVDDGVTLVATPIDGETGSGF